MASNDRLVRLELRWKVKRGGMNGAIHAAGMTLQHLDEGGFIIGVGSRFANAAAYVHADHRARTVSVAAWFLGAGAWKAAAEEDRAGEGVFSIDDFGMVRHEPEVIDHSRGLSRPGPMFKKAVGRGTAVRFGADDVAAPPALLALDGSFIPQWRLPLTPETRVKLHDWAREARAVAALAPAFADEGIHLRWASKQLTSATSPLAKRARELAKLVTKETGCRVRAGELTDPLGGF